MIRHTNDLPQPDKWASASLSDVGLVRSVNEDAYCEMPELCVWVVADGMGGHHAGDLASNTVIESVGSIEQVDRLAQMIEQVCSRLHAANDILVPEGCRRGNEIIGTTAAALILYGRHSVCIWAGDSRVYRLRSTRFTQITRDHRWVEELVEQGMMTREVADTHPRTNEITRAIGVSSSLNLCVELRDLFSTDKFLICSDGLHDEVSDDEIAEILAASNPGDACRELIAAAKRHGARDNITAIVVAQ